VVLYCFRYTMQAADMAKIPLNVRVDPALLEEIKKLAKAENRTVSNLVDTALRRYIENSRKQ